LVWLFWRWGSPFFAQVHLDHNPPALGFPS
jgi:hypothetical protein